MKVKVLTVTPDDCILQTFRSGGNGGQNQNKRDTGVRFIHPPSGARGESREHRTQWQNKKAAWKRMAEDPKFKYWVATVTGRFETDEEYLERVMKPENLKTEIKKDGKWTMTEELNSG